MARLEIEIAGVNAELKRILKESKIELSNFSKGLNFKATGVNTVNTSLTKTKQLLKEIVALSRTATAGLGNINRNSSTSSIQAERLALAQARTEAAGYATESRRLAAELARVNVETAEGRRSQQAHATETARLRAEIQALRLAQQQNRTITEAASGSYREAQQRLTLLGQAIRNAENGFRSTDPAIQAQIRQYRELNRRLREFDAQLGNHQRNIGNYRSALQGLQGLALTYFGFTALLAAGRTVIKNNAEISDSLADVRRTAGLTAREATDLGIALKSIDTRTSLKDLLGISTIGGQLGIAKDQLAGFTKAVDQLSVSLGSELKGGAEGIAKSLGVLDNVFKISTRNGGDIEKAYNQIGSAILKLGQSGLATGDFLADFGERVGGIARQAGISLPVILSYGAVLQENGVSAEVAGTAFKRLLSALSANSGKFFAIAQMGDANLTLKEFNTIVNTDTKKALDLFLQGLNKGGSSTIAFNSILKSLKLSGAGVSQVISALSSNLPGLDAHIKESTTALNDGTLAADQFAIKNNNLAASLDKLSNSFTNLSTNPDSTLASLFKGLVDSITGGIKVIDILLGKLKEVQYDSAIARFDKKGDTGNFFIGANDVKQEKASRAAAKQAEIRNQALKVGAQLNRAALADIQAESNLKTILSKTNERLGNEEKKLAEVRAKYSTATTTKAKDELGKQLIAQREFVRLLKIEAKSLIPRSDTAAPEGFAPGGKKTKSGSGSIATSADVLAKSIASSAISEEEGVNKTLEKLKQRYIGYYAELDNLAKKKGADVAKINSDRALIAANELRERSQIEIAETERVQGEVTRILAEAQVKTSEGYSKELAAADKKYAEEVKKANGNQLLLSAITEAAEKTRADIHQKYADKKTEAEQKVYDKIADITEKGFTDNVKRTVQGSARIDAQLKERLRNLQKSFDELRKLNIGNTLGIAALNVQQEGERRKLTGAATAAKSPDRKPIVVDELKKSVESIGASFLTTLRNINNESGTIFGNIIGGLADSLSTELNNVFSGQLKNTLNDLVSGVKISTTQALGSIAGVLGTVISGITPKTSFVGQGAGGALTGAATGAVAGAALGPGGALIGGVIGGVVGLIGGLFGAGKARKQEALQRKQLEEQQKQTKLLERQNALAYASSIIGRNTTSGIVTGVDVNEFGQVITKVSGSDLLIIHDKAVKSRQRGI